MYITIHKRAFLNKNMICITMFLFLFKQKTKQKQKNKKKYYFLKLIIYQLLIGDHGYYFNENIGNILDIKVKKYLKNLVYTRDQYILNS
jgi:hypothetical protein